MFKEYFTRLFNYDREINLQFAALINSIAKNSRPAELMAHLLNAQQIWLSRCMGTSSPTYQLWPSLEPGSFDNIIINNHSAWISFLNTEIDQDQAVVYTNSKGEEFRNKLIDILAHVINHGTHHRAQIGMLLKQHETIELPLTDYVQYIRSL